MSNNAEPHKNKFIEELSRKKPKRSSTGGVGGNPSGAIATTNNGAALGTKSEDSDSIKEGDFIAGQTTEGLVYGVVEHIMWDGGTLGSPGSEYSLESMPPLNPAMSVRVYERAIDGGWSATAYSIGMMYLDANKIESQDESLFSDFGKDFTTAKREKYRNEHRKD
jgi:hypothetical protein